MNRVLAAIFLSAVSYGASFHIDSYRLSATVNGQNFSSTDAPLAIDYALIGILDVPTLRITGNFGFYNGDYPFGYPGKIFPDSAISLRFTDVTVSCTGGTGSCDPWSVNLQSSFEASQVGSGAILPGISAATFVGIDGTVSNGVLPALGLIYRNVSDFTFFENVGGYFSDAKYGSQTTIPFGGNSSSAQVLLWSDRLPTGTTLSMPGSVWLSFEQAVPGVAAVPEPGTIFLVSAAFVGAWWLRRQPK